MKCNHELVWHNCYKGGFDLISPDSFAHPAKMSPLLCYRILDHLKELGLLNDSDTVLDPMSGTGLTAICANAKGFKAITIELEGKFIGFQKENKIYAGRKLCRELDWTILQGDARKLSELLTERGLITCTSPPYAEAQTGGGISKAMRGEGGYNVTTQLPGSVYQPSEHGTTPGQIGNLKDTPLKVITSPPYGENGTGERGFKVDPRPGRSYKINDTYSDNADNIGNLPDHPLKTVTSPPYEDIRICTTGNQGKEAGGERITDRKYGTTEGNIGNTGESYLEAMKIVYSEIAKVSDVLAIVLKNPTRNGKLRRLDLDTISLLEQTGWTIHCQHQALLFEELEREDMFSGPQKKVKGRMSFFKRLSWQKGQPVAAWEDVIIAVRNGGGNLKVVTSPPYYEGQKEGNDSTISQNGRNYARNNYGDTPGQIGKLRDK